eukprot:CAMPEP_0114671808 /NCGR_PEP_ID=MMETSP0191-20121206/41784_1 /TAXON_ID=126664 /ORGANISM="Sorites sp." /LENGTH=245 /DNA_ID=CAMNT_0001932533 /DNA_START=24 /DNA_END=762 /DNA_ORIENTATION=+
MSKASKLLGTNPGNEFAKGYPVTLHVYDLSGGMAKAYSQQLIGQPIEGIWHTAVVVYGFEYFYGGGIQHGYPAQTPYGKPVKILKHGITKLPQSLFHEFLNQIAERFTPDKYDVFKHNCNNFADEASEFLCHKKIPPYITGLPAQFLNSPVGQMLKPMLENMQNSALKSMTTGDYANMGIALKPNLPKVNPIYNKEIEFNDDDNNSNSNNNNNNNDAKMDDPNNQQGKASEAKENDNGGQNYPRI